MEDKEATPEGNPTQQPDASTQISPSEANITNPSILTGQQVIQEKPKSKNIYLLVIITIVVFIGLFVAAYIFVNNNNNSNEVTQSEIVEPASDKKQAVDAEANIFIEEIGLKIKNPSYLNITIETVDIKSPFDDTIRKAYAVYTPENDKYDEFCKVNTYISQVPLEEVDDYNSSLNNVDGRYFYIGKTIGGCGDDIPGANEYREKLNQYVKDNLQAI